MDDCAIIQMYWDRKEEAIQATATKYGGYCGAIARNILESSEDVEECINDTYLNAWNAMPPQWPQFLGAFLGKITRNLSLNRKKYNQAGKRCEDVLVELDSIVSGRNDLERSYDGRELIRTINAFLKGLPEKQRSIFICRYFYCDSMENIAQRFHMQEGAVTMQLSRTREKLRRYLKVRGYHV